VFGKCDKKETLSMIYAGIGSRETPQATLDLMNLIAFTLAQKGHSLRSGGAKGADSAFEAGASNGGANAMNRTLEIFPADAKDSRRRPEWENIAMLFHPNWQACSEFARTAHSRNTAIVLGERCDKPVDCVICWTPGGAVTGGTGQALRIAAGYGIPVFNLFWPEHVSALWDWIGKI
jgi:hypothetical protein